MPEAVDTGPSNSDQGSGCGRGQVLCQGSCIGPQSNLTYCGASGDCTGASAGTACQAGEVCSAGKCALFCQAGLVNCGGICTDPLTSLKHCGASGDCSGSSAGTACQAGEVCSAGKCALSCQSGLLDCGGSCIDPLTSLTFCGASGSCTGKSAGTACQAGQVCSAGKCALSCQSGLLDCGGTCIDPLTSLKHCGASGDCGGSNAGTTCQAGEVCSAGKCAVSCQTGLVNCGGKCIDPQSSPTHCGASGTCTGTGAGTSCPAGSACVAGKCAPLFMQWGTPVTVGTGISGTWAIRYLQVAYNDGGDGVVVWHSQDSDEVYHVYANRLSGASGTWSGASAISDAIHNTKFPHLALDKSGNAFVVWEQTKGPVQDIYASRYSASSGAWGAPVLIENGTGSAYGPFVAVDASGNAFAVWQQKDGSYYNIYASRYSASSSSWGTPTVIDNLPNQTVYPQVGFDGSGNALAVWQQYYDFYASRYLAKSATWETATLIESETAAAYTPMLAVSANGNAVVAWYYSKGLAAVCYSASNAVWEKSTSLVNGTLVYNPWVAIDGSGNAFLVWEQDSKPSIYASRYSVTTKTWESPTLLESGTGWAADPRVAADGSGNAMVVWSYSPSAAVGSSVFVRRFHAATGSWGTEDLLKSSATGARIAMNSSSHALAVWVESDVIYASIYK